MKASFEEEAENRLTAINKMLIFCNRILKRILS